ncbi:unnamed protein product [Spirodela intermedia]|uniref:Reverse transcriptase Ty1/copia-type domain-containing protein n=1 Tax=Spirodela intermedia TaxID=51605 RepID=A0A7I8KAP9_SPIIN|nr:unnamed protein product [Spirodela intermedia]
MHHLGFSGSKIDTSLYYKCSSNQVLCILIYVDDILVIGSNKYSVTNLIQSLHHEFTIRDLGPAHYFLNCPSVIEDHHSTSGYLIFLDNNLISLSSKKQELGMLLSSSPTLWCDNIGVTYLAVNSVFLARTKHIEIVHFVQDQLADIPKDLYYRGLPKACFVWLSDKLNIIDDMSLRGV